MALDNVKQDLSLHAAVPLTHPDAIHVINLSDSGLPGLFETLISLVREQYRIHGRDPDAAGFEADRATFTLRAPRSGAAGEEEFYTVKVPGELLERADLTLIAEEFYALAYPDG